MKHLKWLALFAIVVISLTLMVGSMPRMALIVHHYPFSLWTAPGYAGWLMSLEYAIPGAVCFIVVTSVILATRPQTGSVLWTLAVGLALFFLPFYAEKHAGHFEQILALPLLLGAVVSVGAWVVLDFISDRVDRHFQEIES
jgi:hypothetical protein